MAISNTTIQIKKSVVSGNTPGSLANGEIAINTADGKLFYRQPDGTITFINNQNSFYTIVANGSSIISTSPTDTLTINPGTNITISACTVTKSITINSTASGNGSGGSGGTITYYQNTAPATSNSHDLWVNSDTGVMYENFGTPSTPSWAEVGPTGVSSNSAPGVFSATQINVAYSPVTTTGTAVTINAANTRGGAGYADLLLLTNTSAGATNPSKTIRVGPTGTLEIINSAYNAVPMYMTDGGDLFLNGNVTMSGIQAGYAPNRPAFRVYGANTTNNLSTTQNGTGQLNSNNWAVDYNQGSYLNSSTGTFTAPASGLYQICLITRNAGNASYSQLACCKNGAANVLVMIEFAGNSTMNHTGGSTVAKLTAGDTLNIRVLAGTINFDANDNWSVTYIG